MWKFSASPWRADRHGKPERSANTAASHISTALGSVTLCGCDSDSRLDIYGNDGNSGTLIATLDDMKVLFGGLNFYCPTTSVLLTINRTRNAR